LPPLLFVNTADLLQAIFNDAWLMRILSLHVDEDFGKNTPLFVMLMIMPVDFDELN
jgi:hypothetical protein